MNVLRARNKVQVEENGTLPVRHDNFLKSFAGNLNDKFCWVAFVYLMEESGVESSSCSCTFPKSRWGLTSITGQENTSRSFNSMWLADLLNQLGLKFNLFLFFCIVLPQHLNGTLSWTTQSKATGSFLWKGPELKQPWSTLTQWDSRTIRTAAIWNPHFIFCGCFCGFVWVIWDSQHAALHLRIFIPVIWVNPSFTSCYWCYSSRWALAARTDSSGRGSTWRKVRGT